jgi:hypothetical protein
LVGIFKTLKLQSYTIPTTTTTTTATRRKLSWDKCATGQRQDALRIQKRLLTDILQNKIIDSPEKVKVKEGTLPYRAWHIGFAQMKQLDRQTSKEVLYNNNNNNNKKNGRSMEE